LGFRSDIGICVYEWDPPEVNGDPQAARYFVGMSRVVDVEQRDEDIAMGIDGTQWSDGRIERYITVNQMHPDDSVTPPRPREVASALIDAADEVDGWAGR
jgi:hypothetical protein